MDGFTPNPRGGYGAPGPSQAFFGSGGASSGAGAHAGALPATPPSYYPTGGTPGSGPATPGAYRSSVFDDRPPSASAASFSSFAPPPSLVSLAAHSNTHTPGRYGTPQRAAPSSGGGFAARGGPATPQAARKADALAMPSKSLMDEDDVQMADAPLGEAAGDTFDTAATGGLSHPPAATEIDHWITVFGYEPSQTSRIIASFERYGEITSKHVGRGNWIHLRYRAATDVQKALTKNAKIIFDNVLVGVVPCTDPAVVQAPEIPSLPVYERKRFVNSAEYDVVPPREAHQEPKKSASLFSLFSEYVLGW